MAKYKLIEDGKFSDDEDVQVIYRRSCNEPGCAFDVGASFMCPRNMVNSSMQRQEREGMFTKHEHTAVEIVVNISRYTPEAQSRQP